MDKIDRGVWKRKATAFSVRSYRQLWGKNTEDPLSFIYLKGISIDLAKSLYLGWNKFGQKRSLSGWGLEGAGTFPIPPGIVFPHIKDKQLLAVLIIPMTPPHDAIMLPGSDPRPILIGSAEKASSHQTHDLLQGLVLLQENPDASITISLA